MIFKLIEHIRKEPIEVRRQVVVLVTLVAVMLVTLVWAGGWFVMLTYFSPHPSGAASDAAPASAPTDSAPQQ